MYRTTEPRMNAFFIAAFVQTRERSHVQSEDGKLIASEVSKVVSNNRKNLKRMDST